MSKNKDKVSFDGINELVTLLQDGLQHKNMWVKVGSLIATITIPAAIFATIMAATIMMIVVVCLVLMGGGAAACVFFVFMFIEAMHDSITTVYRNHMKNVKPVTDSKPTSVVPNYDTNTRGCEHCNLTKYQKGELGIADPLPDYNPDGSHSYPCGNCGHVVTTQAVIK